MSTIPNDPADREFLVGCGDDKLRGVIERRRDRAEELYRQARRAEVLHARAVWEADMRRRDDYDHYNDVEGE